MAAKKGGKARPGGTSTGNESRGYEKLTEDQLTPAARKRLEKLRGSSAEPQPMLGGYTPKKPAKKK